MRLNRHTDFAFRLLIFLALAPGQRASAVEVANAYGISVDHLRKVVQDLVAIGLVRTHRGRGGGEELLADPDTLSAGDVVRAIEGPVDVIECLSNAADCRLSPVCRLRRSLQEAQAAFMKVLDELTISDCVGLPDSARSLLGVEPLVPSP